eukprot:jgi/Chlat1/6924/Chrsp52S06600
MRRSCGVLSRRLAPSLQQVRARKPCWSALKAAVAAGVERPPLTSLWPSRNIAAAAAAEIPAPVPRDYSAVSEHEFHQAADATLENLQEAIESFGDEHDVEGMDVSSQQGVLTASLGSKGTYVINKQTPNRQIWSSSPLSGPVRYDYAGDGRWVYGRDGHELHERLQHEFQTLFQAKLRLEQL